MATIQGFRLSPQQRRLWRQSAGGAGYRAQLAVELAGALDPGRLEEALRRAWARHEILRTSFGCLPGMKLPVQLIEERSQPALEVLDLRGCGAGEEAAEIEQLLAEDESRGLDRDGRWTCRATLLALAADRHVLVLGLPALCADRRSLANLADELGRSYAGLPAQEPEVLQYADFAEWQNELASDEEGEEGRAFWRRRAASPLPQPPLPWRNAEGGEGPDRLPCDLGVPLAVLEELAARLGVGLPVLLAAAWQALLWRSTGEPDIVVGRISEGRKHEDLQGALGLFARCLPCSIRFEEGDGLRRAAERAAAELRETEAWQEYFDHEVGDEGGAAARFAFGFEYEELPAPEEYRGLRLSVRALRARTEPFELALAAVRRDDGLAAELRFDRAAYGTADLAWLPEQLATLLAGAAADPEAPLAGLSLLGPAERRHVVAELNATAAVAPAELCLHQLFERQAARAPERPAVEAGGEPLSYGELNRRANRLAHHLRRLGVGPEVRVALALERSAAMVVALLAVWKSGGAGLPLDLRAPLSRLQLVLSDAAPRVLVTEERLLAGLPPFAGAVVCLDRDGKRLAAEPEDDSAPLAGPDNLAYVTYTSGSTGRPKGVLSTHRGAVNYLDFVVRTYGLERIGSVLQVAALSFDASVRDIVGPLAAGARVLIVGEEEARQPAALLAHIRRHRVEGILAIVPTLFRALVQAARREDPPCDSVRLLVLSGESLDLADVAAARRLFGPTVAVVNQYGPTECTMTSSYWPAPERLEPGARGPAAIGRPIQNVRFYVLASDLSPVPMGLPGELAIGGTGVTRGYLHLPELTAERFIPDPCGAEPGGRLYRTGDLVRRRPDGNLEFLGRGDRQVKVRGVRVELDEIEALLREHPDLAEAAVAFRELPAGTDPAIVAYVVAGDRRLPAAGELRAFLERRLPETMLPALFVPLPALPRTRTGKLDHGALPAPERARAQLAADPDGGRPVATLLAALWGQVLGQDEVGVHDDFFELGGHSLLAAQLMARVQDALGIEIPLRTVFEAPTPAELAVVVESALGGGRSAPPLAPIPRREPPLASFAQQRLWFFHQLDPHSRAYNIARAARLTGPLQVDILAQALSEIARRHETLRTTFAESPAGLVQIIAPAAPMPLPVIDLSDVPEAEQVAASLALASARALFDLAAGPLFRTTLYRLGEEDHVLLLTIHHVVADDWSMGVLVGELTALYRVFAQDAPSPLPELPVQYADFAHWQRSWLRGEVLEEHLSYWREQLAGKLPILELPFGLPRPLNPGVEGAGLHFRLPSGLTERLATFSRSQAVTPFMTLLAAFQAVLYRHTRHQDVIVGSPTAGRNRTELEGLIGYFINALALRTDLSGDPSFRDLLIRVRTVTLGAYTYQDLPFERLVEELQPERKPGHSPIFQVVFNYQNAPMPAVELAGLKLSPMHPERGTQKYDLTLYVWDEPTGLAGRFEYKTDLFEAGHIARLRDDFTALLEGALDDADARLGSLVDLLVTRELEHLARRQQELGKDLEKVAKGRTELPAQEVFEGFRLSPQQRRLWKLRRNGPEFRVRCAARLDGALDRDLLMRSLLSVFARHEILNTSFRFLPGMKLPVQTLEERRQLPVEQIDLRGRDAAAQQAEVERLFGAAPRSGEEVAAPGAVLLALAPDRHLLFLDLSALCADAATCHNLLGELARAYAGDTGEGEEILQYADYAEWQNEQAESEEAERGRAYWRALEAHPVPLLSLPLEGKPAGEPRGQGLVTQPIEPAVALGLESLAQRSQTTLPVLLGAAWQTLVSRLTREREVQIGWLADGRRYEELQAAVGLYARCLPCRVRCEPGASFAQIVAGTDVAIREAEAWQESFDSAESDAEQVAIGLAFERRSDLAGGDVRLSIARLSACIEPLKLLLTFVHEGDGLRAELSYDRALYSEEAVGWLGERLAALLAAVVREPDGAVGELEVLGEQERRVLAGFNQTTREFPRDSCLHELFERQARHTPDRVAVTVRDEALSYADVDARANRLAHSLRRLGVRPEVRVAIALERSPEILIALLGTLKSGGAYVPLDLQSPAGRLRHVLDDSGARVLITEEPLLPRLPSFAGIALCLDRERQRLAAEPHHDPQRLSRPEDLSYITYTSGSTGLPKGVLSIHRGAVNYLDFLSRRCALGEAGPVLQVAALSFDASVRDLLGPLTAGSRTVLVSEDEAKDPRALLARIAEHRIGAIIAIVPTLLRALAQAARPENLPYDSVRLVVLSGEVLRQSDIEAARHLFGAETVVINQYGPTECTMTSSFWPAPAGADAGTGRALVPVGRPIQNVRFHLLDAHRRPVPVGVTGEVYIGGEGVTRGYLNRPDLTAERFTPDPLGEPGSRLYKTGDLARWLPAGELELLGRTDRQVKVRGVRVELDELEALLGVHPSLREVAVVLRQDAQGDVDLVAYFVASGERAVPTAELRALLQESLPSSMLPSTFVPLAVLPRTPTGKVDRAALPSPDHDTGAEEPPAPRTPIEELLVLLWGEVLDRRGLGPHDNFFELGGHSLLATQLTARVQEMFGIELPLRSVFESPTPAELARVAERALRSEKMLRIPAITPVQGDEPLPLSFAQQRLFFLHRLDPRSHAFNVARAARITGALPPSRVALLQRVISEITRRHEILRTTFAEVEGRPVQVVGPVTPVALPLIDLSGLPEPGPEAERLARLEARTPFDLETGPVLRLTLLRIGPDEHVLLYTLHHVASDNWSAQILVAELGALYQAFARERPSPLPELAVQYADFAVWQRQWLDGEGLQAHLSYWRQRLSGAPARIDLPFAKPRPVEPGYRGARMPFLLPEPLLAALQQLSRAEGVTLFMTLLAAFKTLLLRWSGREDVVVGTDVANRTRTEIEPLIGFFVNLLVLRTDLGGDPTFRELLRRVRETTLGAYTHQDLPFEKLVEELQPERTLRRAPLFQYLLVLQNRQGSRPELPGLTLAPYEVDNQTAKFDLALILVETPDGLAGIWNYSTDLFDEAAVRRMSRHLENLLASAVAGPDLRLSQLEYLDPTEREHQAMEKRQRKEAGFAQFMNVQPKAIKLSQRNLVALEPLAEGEPLPLLARPAGEAVDLIDWARGHLDLLESRLAEHGAILFRGFELGSVARFEDFARTICGELFGEYGDLPRDEVAGKVYTSTPYPPDREILFHNESSQLDQWPQKQFFFCVQPAAAGGETPLVDCRRVYRLLRPEVRDRFARLGVMYVRNYTPGLDVDWREFFRTEDGAVVEEYCRRSGMGVEWKADGGLRTSKVCPAVIEHPRTGEPVFFNQIQAHHVSCLPPEDRKALLDLFAFEDLPRNVYYGDGSPIEDEVMAEVIAVYRQLAVASSWQKGDLIMLDNMLTAHGRYPFSGPRKIVVAMGAMVASGEVWRRDGAGASAAGRSQG